MAIAPDGKMIYLPSFEGPPGTSSMPTGDVIAKIVPTPARTTRSIGLTASTPTWPA